MAFEYTAYIPTQTGFSVAMSDVTCRYAIFGKMLHWHFYADTAGTSNANSITLTLPVGVTAKSSAVFKVAQGVDNGAVAADAIGLTAAAGNVVTFYKTSQAGAWTTSGSKKIGFNVAIEIE
jgi:hypothetical protein